MVAVVLTLGRFAPGFEIKAEAAAAAAALGGADCRMSGLERRACPVAVAVHCTELLCGLRMRAVSRSAQFGSA